MDAQSPADEVMALRLTSDDSTCGPGPVANGSCRVWVALHFPSGADAGHEVVLRVDSGTLKSGLGSAPSDREVTVKTVDSERGGMQAAVAYVLAPTAAGTVQVSAQFEDVVATKMIDFGRSEPERILLSGTVRTFRAQGGRASDFEIAVSASLGVPSVSGQVHIHHCCPDLPGTRNSTGRCDRYLDTPDVVTTGADQPTLATFEGRLTAAAEDYLSQETELDDEASIAVIAAANPIADVCEGADVDSILEVVEADSRADAVELRLVRTASATAE